MTNIVKFDAPAGALTSLSDLSKGMSAVHAVGGSLNTKPFLKLDRHDGVWVFGQDNTEVEEGSLWAVNPFSLETGFICWGDSRNILGEEMRPAGAPPVNQADLPHFEGFSWAAQLQLDLVCISGSDTEQEVRFKTTALGGKRAVSAIAGAIGMRAGQGIPFVVPVVELAQDSYQHKSYGLIYTPEFKVSFWADQEMNAEPGALPEKPAKAAKAAKAAPAEKPESGGRTRRRTRARTRG